MKHFFTLWLLMVASFSVHAQAVTTIAGGSSWETYFNGDNIPATEALIDDPYKILFDAQGNILFSDRNHYRVRKIDSNGIITTVAGAGPDEVEEQTPNGDGVPATQTNVFAHGIALDAQGNLYIVDFDRVRKVDQQGIITTIAGIRGVEGFSGDGGLATSAELDDPKDVAIDAQGNIYISDTDNRRIRKIAPNGIITTIAGTGGEGFNGDGGPATQASLFSPGYLELDAQGNLYVSDLNRIRKIDRQGIITTVVGSGTEGFSGDGGPATQANLHSPQGMSFDQEGNLFFCDRSNKRVRKVDTQGIITTVVGTGQLNGAFNGDGRDPLSTNLSLPTDVAVDGQGNLLITDLLHHRIRKVISTAQPLAIGSLFLIDADQDTALRDLVPVRNYPTELEFNLMGLPTRKLNIQATTDPSSIGSVVFKLSGQQTLTHIENAAPYALFKDDGGNFRGWTPAVGSYTLTATPYSGPNGTGTAGDSVTISFTVVDHIRVDHFDLINPITNQAGLRINDAERITLDHSGEAYNIQAVTSPATVGSVIFTLSGQQTHSQLENGAPYALFGDTNGDYKDRRREVGHYTVTATPYSGPNGTGAAGISKTVHFEFYFRQTPWRLSAEQVPDGVEVFPNPFTESFTIESKGAHSGPQTVELYDLLGRRVWQGVTSGDKQMVPVGSQLGAGAYILRVGEGTRTQHIKLLKQP
ncbi:putative secreted protein (Por secretion system target) [Larkinella arboricola]|uniref:Putative secreted protein (Por secretion system target) n=1 Tax=Larkinella arboricola TaxID=643671 RepID=A0A327X2D6_LARAB|nr:T9SS type A sorting domain-containing protein [Larkinella arboricola]RAK00290.1 putative secreted protein (Por secretion system target) [Larkinella arboricola]